MPHIHTDVGDHDATIAAFIIRTDMDQPRILLHMHKKLHSLLPVGGHIETKETPWQAVAHEIAEEAGYDIDELFVMQPKSAIQDLQGIIVHPQPFLSNTHLVNAEHYHTDLDYVLLADHAPKHEVAEGESTDLRWLSAADVAVVPGIEIRENIRQIAEHIFTNIIGNDQWHSVSCRKYAR